MTEPTFDKDGYPTDETLDAIEKWNPRERIKLFQFIEKAWSYPEYWRREGDILSISTGGWSGNESLIGALKSNHMAWVFSWESSRRGGHYEFEVKATVS